MIVASAVLIETRPAVAANSHTDNENNAYAAEISKTYDFKFGPNPFSPGNATTTTGTFIPGEMFVRREALRHLSHRRPRAVAAVRPRQRLSRTFLPKERQGHYRTQKGIEFTRHCESCHNPAALFQRRADEEFARQSGRSTMMVCRASRAIQFSR